MKLAAKRRNGLTLVELLVTLAIFALLSGSILSTFIIAFGYWRSGNALNDAQGGGRFALQTLMSELSQAIVDPDPGGINPPTGYLSINPPLSTLPPPLNEPTGILLPNGNAGQQTSSTLLFNEANTSNYNPFSMGWNPNSAANYRKVQYSVVGGNTLQRSETDYDQNGNVIQSQTDPVVEIKNGTIAIQANYNDAYTVNLQVTAQKDGKTYFLSSEAFAPGGTSQ